MKEEKSQKVEKQEKEKVMKMESNKEIKMLKAELAELREQLRRLADLSESVDPREELEAPKFKPETITIPGSIVINKITPDVTTRTLTVGGLTWIELAVDSEGTTAWYPIVDNAICVDPVIANHNSKTIKATGLQLQEPAIYQDKLREFFSALDDVSDFDSDDIEDDDCDCPACRGVRPVAAGAVFSPEQILSRLFR